MDKDFKNLSIAGVRLGQNVSTLEHLTSQKSFFKTEVHRGLEQWDFNNGRGDLEIPSSIKFLDGAVIEVEGRHLVAPERKLTQTSEINDIVDCLERLGLRNFTKYPDVLFFRSRYFEVIVVASRPMFKTYCVIDIEANGRWKARYRHGKQC